MSDMTGPSIPQVRRPMDRPGEEYRSHAHNLGAAAPPVGLATKLFCAAYGWMAAPQLFDRHDATDADGKRYLVRSRRLTAFDSALDLPAIRNLDTPHFDHLAAATFDGNNHVLCALIMPVALVREEAAYQRAINAHIFYFDEVYRQRADCVDATDALRAVRR